MNVKKLTPLAVSLLMPALSFGQTYDDAARFGMLIPQGTARSIGFGSALGSVGGDFSSLSVNPAGIGIYRKSEFSFSPSFHFGSDELSYFGTKTDQTSSAFNISNLSLVSVAAPRNRTSGWRSYGFGIGLNRVADFNRSYSYRGRNDSSAFSETFALDANQQLSTYGNLGDQSLGNLGYQSYLIDYDSLSNSYYPLADYRFGPLNQLKSVRERGGINELVLNAGGNYDEKIMVGATLGIPILRYRREMTFQETDATGAIPDFQEARFQQTLTTNGVGVNAKFGVIVKPSNLFRFGAAIHTPTWYSLRDREDISLFGNTEGSHQNVNVSLDTREFNYTIRTPWRAVVSATVFGGTWGFLSADYEYVDYASSKIVYNTQENQDVYGSGYFNVQQQLANDSLKANLQGASNFRIGIETHLDKLFIRAGLGFYGAAYKNTALFGNGITTLNAGLGYRGAKGFIDVGFMQSTYKTGEYAYQLPYGGATGTIAPTATGNAQRNNLVVTIGTKF